MKKLTLIASLFILSVLNIHCGFGLPAHSLQKDNGSSSTPNVIQLERQFQRVITYDCAHNVVSDSIETVKSPTYKVEITPTQSGKIDSSKFLNTRNGATPNWVSDYTKFTIDYSFGFFNMHVDPGINVINYKFYKCPSWGLNSSGQPICLADFVVFDEGSVTLDIRYTETTLPGAQERTNCPKSN